MKNYELELKIKKFTSIDYFFFEAFFAAGFFAAAFAMLWQSYFTYISNTCVK